MNTMKNLMCILIAGAMLAGCGKSSFKKTAGGMPYKLYKGKDTTSVKVGDYIKVSYTQTIKDSVYFTTVGTLPIYLKVNETPQPYDISELWTSLKVGDSIIATQMMDTFIKRMPQNIPPEFKNGMRIVTNVKILAVYASDSAVKEDDDKTRKELMTREVALIEKYLADKKITALKTPSGAYLEITTPGTGALADSGNYVTINYTGQTWAGKKFDSNVDTSFQHVGPYSFVAGAGRMMKGFDEAVLMMNKGAKGKIFIPSSLAYGANPTSPLIKPFENLIFDIELADIQPKEPARPNVPPNVNPAPGEMPQPK